MQVVEHDDTVRRVAGVQRVDDLGRDGAILVRRAADACEQRLRRGTPGRVEGLQRRQHAFREALHIVAFVGRDPRKRRPLRQSRRLLREKHRLSVTRGSTDEHHAAVGERVAEAAVQRPALDVVRARTRRLDLRAGESHAASAGYGNASLAFTPKLQL